ncbi:MAG: hypothetical protein Q4D13_09105 [Erysipelotrichaceae bacterium]|nr:hypothetical protein [Erysipelotrichaceae bacterium]
MKKIFIIFIGISLMMITYLNMKDSDISYGEYVYEREGFGGDFIITINEDHSFEYYEGSLSSYIGYGEWSIKGNTITLNDYGMGDKTRTIVFKISDKSLIYIGDKSDNFIYVKVEDKDRFILKMSDNQP